MTVGLAVHAFLVARHGWWIFDDWLLIAPRRQYLRDGDLLGFLFRSHNGHLSAVFVVWHYVVTELFGINSYVPMLITLILADVIVVVLLRTVLLHLGCRSWLASTTAPLLLLWGRAGSTVYFTFDASFVAAVAGVLGALLLVWNERPTYRRDWAAAVLLLVAVGMQSLALFGLFAITITLWLQRRFRSALIVALPAVIGYGAWSISYGRLPAGEGQWRVVDWRTMPLADQVSFGWRLVGAAFSGFAPWGMGDFAAVLIACAATGLSFYGLRRQSVAARSLAGTCCLIGLLFVAAVSHERALAASAVAAQDRYVYVITVFFFPFFVLALQRCYEGMEATPLRVCALLLVTAAVVVAAASNVMVLYEHFDNSKEVSAWTKRNILALAASPGINELPRDVNIGFFTIWVTVGELRPLIEEGVLSPSRVSAEALADVQAAFFVRAEPKTRRNGVVKVSDVLGGRLEYASPGCRRAVPDDVWGRVSAVVKGNGTKPVSVQVTTPLPHVEYSVRRGNVSSPTHLLATNGSPVNLRAATATGYEVLLALPGGSTLCAQAGELG